MAQGAVARIDTGETPPLTSLAAGAGCGCKLPPAALFGLLEHLADGTAAANVLVGSASSDDAAVLRLSDELALVQTIDFFTPPVDDPYDFGRIAAANALSDIYAMGATPLSALNIVAFPLRTLGAEVLARVLEGGAAVAAQAGAPIVGGHSIEDAEPKYGLAVSGLIDPRALVTNAGGQPGDVLVLTKPLGVGAIMAAQKRGACADGPLAQAVATMVALNAAASREAVAAGVHAMTDVTGFGLLGHLHHMARESGLAAHIDSACVPHLDGVEELLGAEQAPGVSGGSLRNAEWAERFASFDDAVPRWRRRLLVDPTTSGGLLVAVAAERAHQVAGAVVGRLAAGAPGKIRVV